MPKNIEMDESLRQLIERAKEHKMTPDERREQIASFVWGNMPHENTATRQEIADAIRQREGEAA